MRATPAQFVNLRTSMWTIREVPSCENKPWVYIRIEVLPYSCCVTSLSWVLTFWPALFSLYLFASTSHIVEVSRRMAFLYPQVQGSCHWLVTCWIYPRALSGKFIISGASNSVRHRTSTKPILTRHLDSDIIHLDVAGTSIIVLDSFEAATDLLEKRSSLYSSRFVKIYISPTNA